MKFLQTAETTHKVGRSGSTSAPSGTRNTFSGFTNGEGKNSWAGCYWAPQTCRSFLRGQDPSILMKSQLG